MTTYRFYVTLPNPGDRMSAVFGNNEAPLILSAPAGVYNSALNASWNPSGINPAFLVAFPELASDTYGTIGLEDLLPPQRCCRCRCEHCGGRKPADSPVLPRE